MTISKLTLYNAACELCGLRELSSDSEDVPHRHSLDNAYNDPGAIAYCLELVKPRFGSIVATLSSPSSRTEGLVYQYTLPSDYITLVGVFSDVKLDQPIHRYSIEGRTINVDYASNIYLRYIENDAVTDFTEWTPLFFNVVAAYLARQIAPRWKPQKLSVIQGEYDIRLAIAVKIEKEKEPERRSTSSTATLSNTWRKIYNKALFIIGLDEIVSNTDDSNRRSKCDVCVGLGLVETVLEDVGWAFGLTSQKITYDPSLEPGWGFQRVFAKPSDMHRISGIFFDEHFSSPIKDYRDEGDNWFCGVDVIYVEYVKTSFLTNPDSWPQYFSNLVSSHMAVEICVSLGGDIENAEKYLERNSNEAESTDAMSSPPQMIRAGSWVRSKRESYTRSRRQ